MGFDPLSSLADLAAKVIDKVLPDPKQKADALLKLKELEQSGDLAAMAQQVEVNKIDAASNDPFQRRWRPFIGWICGAALATQLVVGPLVSWGSRLANHPIDLPPMQTELLTTLLVGMLGLGGMRTVEKLNSKH